MKSRYYPWSAIGRVEYTKANGKSYYCTGTLIADDIVLTNAHCVIDSETHQLSKELRFLPNVINAITIILICEIHRSRLLKEAGDLTTTRKTLYYIQLKTTIVVYE
ncbi:trypsin-like serine peptidase [Nostoc sp. DedSLP04]|uniref:trypsin-like serine peptidase n=1 Tax=Nostoc sp. DedSLP04 TaxID=3075401 RepID=UPI002AD2F48E|nr:trypsin-like serine protease [Nostoc sp. DedSLP04]MDZ8033882.1 trypsin-like serine protease [Nostoc sp. DedSLP04]